MPPAPSSSGPGYDLSGLTPFAVFIAIFGSAVAYLKIRTRMASRRSLTRCLMSLRLNFIRTFRSCEGEDRDTAQSAP